ncbi:class I SAM-dependent methyltransferase [Phenylobacterium sp.]|uniref:class I SAM-dependent methyltransferase n=1 Tax=Phenylobacterium sp. TaxID=1871053 RepID=UPI0025D061B0|nr:class I SAM-dependent methyltransferase [Phenylobacterium sp.]
MDAGAIRADLTSRLRAPSEAATACKVCGGEATPLGIVDFNRSCEDARGVVLPRTGVPIQYRQCAVCGLIFTDTFDDWVQADFEAHVYNEGYAAVDPDYVAKRPQQMAGALAGVLAASKAALDILDYGGGNGRFAEAMVEAGFHCATYDPYTPRFAGRPARRFNLITCLETLEHMPDPAAGVGDIVALLEPGGAVVFATLAQPPGAGLGWWYIGPRNGHVTLFSRAALAALWGRFGFAVASFNDHVHMAWREAPPAWARHLAVTPA